MLTESGDNPYEAEPSVPTQISEEAKRQYRLREKTEAFLQGKISAQELEKVVEEEDVDYEQASFGLTSAASDIASTIIKLIKNLKFF